MIDKPNKPTEPRKTDEIKDLPPKALSPDDEEKTKGGRRGPGTQTEDDIYVG